MDFLEKSTHVERHWMSSTETYTEDAAVNFKMSFNFQLFYFFW